MHCAVWKKERRPPPHAGIEGEREKKEERGKTRGGEEDHCLKVDVGGRKQERKRVIAYILERKEKECPPHHPLDVKKTFCYFNRIFAVPCTSTYVAERRCDITNSDKVRRRERRVRVYQIFAYSLYCVVIQQGEMEEEEMRRMMLENGSASKSSSSSSCRDIILFEQEQEQQGSKYHFPPHGRPSISMSTVPEISEDQQSSDGGSRCVDDERPLLELPSRHCRSPRGSLSGAAGIAIASSSGGGGDDSSRNNSGCSVGSNASSTISWSSLQALRLAAAKARSTSLPHHVSGAHDDMSIYEYSLVLAASGGGSLENGASPSPSSSSRARSSPTPPSRGSTPPTQLRLPTVNVIRQRHHNYMLHIYFKIECLQSGVMLSDTISESRSMSASPTAADFIRKGERTLLP